MKGKLVLVDCVSQLILTEHKYSLIDRKSNSSKYKGKIIGWPYSFAAKTFLSRRLFRAEVTGAYKLSKDVFLLIAKKGLYRKDGDKLNFEKVFSINRGSKPLNLCVLPNKNIYFGEYFQNSARQSVNIYGSKDNGKDWRVVYSFKTGEINHVHGLFYDHFSERVWVVTGDRLNECLIGYTEDEFETFHEVFRGGQEYRCCQLFFYEKFICFATDSQYIENEIKYFDREKFVIKTITKIQGSAIKGGQFGNVSFLSTTIEPSEVNRDQYAHVWVTRDGLNWKDVYSAKKDCWPSIFQFGTFEFPQYYTPITDKLYCSGRALKNCDGKTICIDISDV